MNLRFSLIKSDINTFFQKIFSNDIYVLLIFIFLSLILWRPILFNNFLNDDFQILQWLKPHSFADIFKPFYEKEPLLFYWRPIVNFLNSLTIFLFGFKAFPFLLQNLVIYSLICYLIFLILKMFGVKSNISFLSSLVFFVLPSHDLPIAWIACRYDLFMTLFILLSIYFYQKILFYEKNYNFFYYFLLALFALFSIFSKEHSFFLLSLGFVMFLLEPKKIKLHSIFIILIGLYIAIYFLLRAFLIGGSPFNSSNFANINFLDLISNFFLYLITSLIHPELFLVFIQNKELNFIFISQIFIILVITFHLVFLLHKFKPLPYCLTITNADTPKKLCFFSFLFYLFSVIPVLPLYMRWYSFFPFIGIIIFFAAIIFEIDSKIENLALKENFSKNKLKLYTLNLLYLFISIYILISLIFNYNNAKKWNLASNEVTKVLNSLKFIEISASDTLTLWGIPDKIEGVNAMKLGVEQSVHYSINKENVNVKAPLRIECDKDYSLSLNTKNDSIFTFTLKGGILKHQFTDRFDIDSIFVENDEYILKILNNSNYKEKSGFAELFFKKRNRGTIDIAWTGKNFKKF